MAGLVLPTSDIASRLHQLLVYDVNRMGDTLCANPSSPETYVNLADMEE